MMLSPLRLISWLLALLIIGLPAAAIAFFVLAITGSPGSCEEEGRPIAPEPSLAASFQQDLDQLKATLEAGRVATVVLDDREVTARARLWSEEHDLPISDIVVCFSAEGAAASGKIDIPFLPVDVDVLIRGTVDLTGEHAEIVIEEIEVGGLPGPVAERVKAVVDNLIEDQMEELELGHFYGVAFEEGEMTISGQP